MRPRAIFFGTPRFAVPCLEALCDIADVVRVVCQPDRPAGRGMLPSAPPVKARALERGLEVVQPVQVRTAEFAAALRALEAELALVVAYGRILPRGLLEAPRRGCVNVHASLLPRWRGAAPIQWSVVEGDAETGVCLMEMDEGLDTGPVFARAATPIGRDETSVELGDRLAAMGAALVRDALPRWLAGELRAEPQDPRAVTIARLLTKQDACVDLAQRARRVHDHVRGMQPWPGTSVRLLEPDRPPARVKIHRTRVVDEDGTHGEPGAILAAGPDEIVLACGRGSVAILELQLEGKKRLTAREFLAGRRLARMARFSRDEAGAV